MGRRKARKVIRRMPKRIPKVFRCPHCGEPSIIVEMDKPSMQAEVKCGRCQIKSTIPIHKLSESVDVYAKFLDRYYGGAVTAKETSTTKPEGESRAASGSAQTTTTKTGTPEQSTTTSTLTDAARND